MIGLPVLSGWDSVLVALLVVVNICTQLGFVYIVALRPSKARGGWWFRVLSSRSPKKARKGKDQGLNISNDYRSILSAIIQPLVALRVTRLMADLFKQP